MQLLILSDRYDIDVIHRWIGYQATTDGVDLVCQSLAAIPLLSLVNYHVSIVHLSSRLPDPKVFHKLSQDTQVALEQGRTIICVLGTPDIDVVDELWDSLNLYPEAANLGTNIQLTQHGKAQIFQAYFEHVDAYFAYWIAHSPTTCEKTIAVIGDTELVIAAEYSIGRGKIVVLPPPLYNESVAHLIIPSLYNMARKYYEDMQKRIFVGDEPPWVEEHKTQEHLQIQEDIENLEGRKQEFDMITYLLYGTGDELVDSVKLTLEKLSLEAEKTPPGATFDLTARNTDETIKLAIEVTGTTDKIKKESKKVSQAWTYSLEKEDEEEEKLILIANTYNGLSVEDRSDKLHFTLDVENKFTSINALLMTTVDLYFLWKDVHEKKRNADEVLKLLYKSTGIFAIPSS